MVAGETPSLTGEFLGEAHKVLEGTQTHLPANQHMKGHNLLVGSKGREGTYRKWGESQASGIVPSLTLPPQTVPQCSKAGCPTLANVPYNITGALRRRNMAQMKEQIKTPEKELSDKEIDNLSDAEFKTLFIRMLTELIEFGCKMREEVKA